jgi:UDP-N-acetylmuramate dehydrogenase
VTSRRATATSVVEALRARCRDVRTDEPLSRHVSFRIGGPADVLVVPRTAEELRAVARWLYASGEPFVVLGRGSNVLVSDRGVRGVVLKVGHGLDRVRWDGTWVRAEAGVGLPRLAFRAAGRGLRGLEFAAGIPGSVGGAVVMNAGAHGHSTQEVVRAVHVVTPSGEQVWPADAMGFGYRTSRLQSELGVVVEVEMSLAPDDPTEVSSRLHAWLRHRGATQPVRLPSSGCIFRNPPGDAAGRLVDLAGGKGLREGGVEVSTLHANYVVNTGGGRAEDVLRLVERVRERVRRAFGVELELEVQLVGEF